MPDGYWFEQISEQKDLPTAEYGCMVATPAYVIAQIDALSGAELVSYRQSFWWDSQDTYVVRRSESAFHRGDHGQANALRADLAAQIRIAEALRSDIATIHASHSWRVTSPLRGLATRLARRKYAKVVP